METEGTVNGLGVRSFVRFSTTPQLLIRVCCNIQSEPITVWDAHRIAALSRQDYDSLRRIIEEFGIRSAKAQALGSPITDIYRLRNSDQRLYLYAHRTARGTIVFGGLKVGKKSLYYYMAKGGFLAIEPTCVLDFYVHESCQRGGIGLALMKFFLEQEGLNPAALAYDRPSPKLLGFLNKHYGLRDYFPQANNYVIFDQYFRISQTNASDDAQPTSSRPTNTNGMQGANAAPYSANRQRAPQLGAYPGAPVSSSVQDSLDHFQQEVASRGMSPNSFGRPSSQPQWGSQAGTPWGATGWATPQQARTSPPDYYAQLAIKRAAEPTGKVGTFSASPTSPLTPAGVARSRGMVEPVGYSSRGLW